MVQRVPWQTHCTARGMMEVLVVPINRQKEGRNLFLLYSFRCPYFLVKSEVLMEYWLLGKLAKKIIPKIKLNNQATEKLMGIREV